MCGYTILMSLVRGGHSSDPGRQLATLNGGITMGDAGAAKRKVVELALGVGDWIDVMDGEGTWNVAQVLSFPSPTQVEVRYDGWGDAFDEVVLLNGDRVAPYHTYTWTVKCWAKYKNWPWWPSIVTIRPPGAEAGIKHLMSEKRLFVDFLDQKDFTKRCRCWIDRSKVEPFELRFDERRKRTTGAGFESSLALVLQSTAVNDMPKFVKGTLPTAYSIKVVDPVSVVRKRLHLSAWISSFNSSRERHATVYVYKTDGIRNNPRYLSDSDDGSDGHPEDVIQLDEYFENEDEETAERARARKGKVKARKKVKTEPPVKTEAGSLKSAKTTKKATTEPHVSTSTEPAVKLGDSDEIVFGNSPKPDEEPQYLSPIDDDGVYVAGDEDEEIISLNKSASDAEPSGENDSFLHPSSHGQDSNEPLGDSLDNEADKVSTQSGESSEMNDARHEADVAVGVVDEPPAVEPMCTDDPPSVDVEADDDVVIEVDDVVIEVDDAVEDAPTEAVMPSDSSKNDVDEDEGASNIETPSDPLDAWDTTRSPSTDDVVMDHAPRENTSGAAASMDEERATIPSVSSAPSTSREVDTGIMREDEPRQNRLVTAKRKGGKSLIDECIAVSLGHLTEGDKEASMKKRKSSTKWQSNQTQNAEAEAVSTAASSVQHTPETVDTRQLEVSGEGRDASRRSSMSAGGKGGSTSRGRTPVWVIPPPKHLPTESSDSSPRSASTVVPLQQVFSSEVMFDSPAPFSIKKWFDRTKSDWN